MITVVSGLPRSGTSLMMQILKAGGIEILTDDIRKPDENNPKGYYEFEKVKSLKSDNSWLPLAEGKAVKVIAQLIPFLPLEHEYGVVFMERNVEEILISQDKMIERMGGKKVQIDKSILKATFQKQADTVKKHLTNNNISFTVVNYNELIMNSENTIKRINSELELRLKIDNALHAIDDSLYRNRL